MSADKYNNFSQLKNGEREGRDFRICVAERRSAVAIIAPHGGMIEPRTSEIAAAIAGDSFSLYCFEGTRKRSNSNLHITSHHFDEPRCLELIEKCTVVIAVHGLAGKRKRVEVGGLDTKVRKEVCKRLEDAGFASELAASTGKYAATDRGNICNKGRSQAGIQLEISKGLRDHLARSPSSLSQFANAVRAAINERN
jgi:phage replication-related protein YjqB (UPF0714/DUF867 family)